MVYTLSLYPFLTYVFVRNWRGAEGDAHHGGSSDKKEDDRKVEVVDAADQPRAAAGEEATPCPVNEFGDHPGHAHSQPHHQAPECTLQKERKKME